MRAAGGPHAQAVDDRVGADEGAGGERQHGGAPVAQAGGAARQGEAGDAEPDQQDRQLAGAAELLAQEADRDDSHDEGRHAARQRVDEAEVGRLVGAIEEQHVARAEHRARRQIGPALRRRNGDEGNEGERQDELVNDSTRMRASRSLSVLTSAFHVAWTRAAARTIRNTSIGTTNSGIRPGSAPTVPGRRRTAGSWCGSRWRARRGRRNSRHRRCDTARCCRRRRWRRACRCGATSSSAGRAMAIQISISTKSTGPSIFFSVWRRSPSRSSMKRLRPASSKWARAARAFVGLVFGADHHAVAARRRDIVAHGGGEIERRHAVGRADLDDAPRIAGAAELVAELGLVAVERHQLVAAKGFQPRRLVGGRRLRLVDPLGVVGSKCCELLVAPGMQAGQQAFQLGIVKHTHRSGLPAGLGDDDPRHIRFARDRGHFPPPAGDPQSGVRASRRLSLETCINPPNGRPSSRMR